jgi:hypothetical protein
MSRKIQLLPGGKYLSGGVLYKPGALLPDTQETRELVKRKKALLMEDEQEEEQQTDGYGVLKVKDLTALTKERGILLPSGANKAQIIELLRAWDDSPQTGESDGGDAENEGTS